MDLLYSFLRTLSCALFLTLFNLVLTMFLTEYHFDRSILSSCTQLSATLLFMSYSRSRIKNCFFGKIVCFTTRPTIAENTDSLLPSIQTTDGSDLKCDLERESECNLEFDGDVERELEFEFEEVFELEFTPALACDCEFECNLESEYGLQADSESLSFRRPFLLVVQFVPAVLDLMISLYFEMNLPLSIRTRASFPPCHNHVTLVESLHVSQIVIALVQFLHVSEGVIA